MNKLLNPPARKKGRWYCGPYVMAAITGESFETIRAAINRAKGRPETRGVCGVMPRQLKAAFKELGWKNFPTYDCKYADGKMTLKAFMKGIKVDDDSIYVVYITGHYVAVQGDMFIDTFSTHKVSTAFAPRTGKTVKAVYKMSKITKLRIHH